MASSKFKTKTNHYYGCPDEGCKCPDFEKPFRAEGRGMIYGTFTKDGEEDLEMQDLSLDELVDKSKITMEAGYVCMTCGEKFDKPTLWIEEEKIACSHCDWNNDLYFLSGDVL